ncbi:MULTISPECIES: RNA 2',3'-cyclic phosphodiesterase [Dictyoglomus]|jgi:2'-5' RNA ligase|uniref:RNA 2',3'-cyclic phosphodiesterase n=1 Tax=Dictyoglomus turgidum (strain DSM 6724 / Z-1310) TaxID=515635 RepID=B8E0Z9_DICTD|nr:MULTISPECIES: RNA 2',3'-cyclic phosphodiesterase [Dictyoglomus]ACK42736.1 2'-5' RNA ligase [Dictyoglomus turgidum DSM 6724]HBU30795.1 RNA 2',3'-cyclic phosphodiesterase [Dictyoglomus sp.]
MAKRSSDKNTNYKRLFIAIEFEDSVKEHIYKFQKELKASIIGDIKWVEKENFHLTIRFLGETPESLIEDVKSILEEVSNYVDPFYISLEGFGAFPSLKSPRVLWIGIEEGLEELEKIFDFIEKRLVKKGLKKEDKPFSPHLTLGRVKDKDIKILKESSFSKQVVFVNSITLFESRLTSQGPIYTPIYKVSFGKK